MAETISVRNDEEVRLSRRDALAMGALMVSIGLAILDTAIANTALPSIAIGLETTPAASVWIINAYQLAAVATLFPFAAFGSVIGHRRIYIAGLVIFTLASAACALSTSLITLIGARMLQGIGASALMSVNAALIATLYPPAILGRGLGLNALVVGVSFAVGPTAASVILSLGPWQWLFAVNVPIGLIAMTFAIATLPHTKQGGHRFDHRSAGLTIVAFSALIYGLSSAAQGNPWPWTTTALIVSFVTTVILVRYERNQRAPMLPVDLMRKPVFALSTLTAFCAFATQGVAFVSLPFLLENVLGVSPSETGFVMTPWSTLVALMAPIAGRLSDRIAPGLLGGIGLAGLTIGMTLLATLPKDASIGLIAVSMIISGIGFGLFQAPNQRALLSGVPEKRRGGASGVVATARLTGQASGAALVAFSFGIAGSYGPTLALALGAVFAAFGCLASFSRLFAP